MYIMKCNSFPSQKVHSLTDQGCNDMLLRRNIEEYHKVTNKDQAFVIRDKQFFQKNLNGNILKA